MAYFLVPVAKPEKPEKPPNKRTWDPAFFGDKGGKGKGKNKFMQQAWQSGKSGKGKTGKGKDKTQLSPSSAQGSRPKLRGQANLLQPQFASRLQLPSWTSHLYEVPWRSFLLSLRQVTVANTPQVHL